MSRRIAILIPLLLATPLWNCPPACAQVAHGRVLSRALVAQKGLHLAWFTQVQLDASRDRMTYLLLDRGWLFAQSELGVVHVLDAETGVTIWSEIIGEPNYPTLPLAVNDRFVVVINGSTVYLLRRSDGRAVFAKQMKDSVPNAAPVLSPGRIYMPTMRGLIASWQLPLDKETSTALERERQRTQTVWRIHSAGRSPTQLLVTPHSVCWPTDTGYLYLADRDDRKVRYRVELTDRIVATLGYRNPMLVAGSLGGFVWAVNEIDGKVLWRVSTGYPIRQGPVVIDDCIFVCPERHGMLCLDSEKGNQQWWAPSAAQFVAVSTARVYASDRSKRLLVLDAKTGDLQATLATDGLPIQLVNEQTDRVYLGTPSGLLQCLHEPALKEPLNHVPPPPAEGEQQEGADGAETGAAGGDAALPTDAPAPQQPPGDQPPPERLPFDDG